MVRFIASISVLARDLLIDLCQVKSLNSISLYFALGKILLLVFMNCNEGFINIKPWIFHEDLEIFGSKYVLAKTAGSQIALNGVWCGELSSVLLSPCHIIYFWAVSLHKLVGV